MDDPVQTFRQMNADVGIEMTLEEANVNYAACMAAMTAMTEGGHTIEETIDIVQRFADPCFHPGVCRKFLTEAKMHGLLDKEDGDD